MIIKNLTIEDFIFYKEIIKKYMVDSYMIEFDISFDDSVDLINERLVHLDKYIKENAILIGAIEEEYLVGFIWIFKHNYFGEERLHINEIIVDSKYQGRGIGASLLREAEKKADALGVKAIDLIVSEKNLVAMSIYDKLGFTTERRYFKKRL